MHRNIIFCILFLAAVSTLAFGAERDTPRTPSPQATLTAGETVYTGLVVGQKNGYAYLYVKDSTNLTVIGVAQNSVASNGLVRVRGGIYGLKNDGTVTAAHIGGSAYAATNNAYAVAASGTAAVGKICAVDTDYVWVRCGP